MSFDLLLVNLGHVCTNWFGGRWSKANLIKFNCVFCCNFSVYHSSEETKIRSK